MVKIYEQVKDILLTFLDEYSAKEFTRYLVGVSFQIEKENEEQFLLYAYNDNRLDFLKEYFRVDIQKINQKYTYKKIKRMEAKMKDGNSFFIRWYGQYAENIDDFRYVKVVEIKKTWYGVKKVQLSNGEQLFYFELERKMKRIFHKLQDWVVYEDINFLPPDITREANSEKLYLSRLYNQIWCASKSKLVMKIDKKANIRLNTAFIRQREYVYRILKTCKTYSPNCEYYMGKCIEIYKKLNVTWEELCNCFKMEFQLLEMLTEEEEVV